MAAQPPGMLDPAALMYSGPVAHATYFHARSSLGVVLGIASAHDHSQPDASVSLTGAGAYPFFPLTGLSLASSRPAATVASYHIATLPSLYCDRHSLKLALAASFSPASCTRFT